MITLTESAASHISDYLTNRKHGIGIRLGTRRNGCSGLSYVIEFADEVEKEDRVYNEKGVKIIIDPTSLIALDGTELDYVKEGLNEGFKFNNPNVKDECGCGESFNV